MSALKRILFLYSGWIALYPFTVLFVYGKVYAY